MTRQTVLVVFDLDDTLFLERDFVSSGFAAVGSWMRREAGISGFGQTCQELFDAGYRGQIFDFALEYHGLPDNTVLVEKLVAVYRTHDPEISLAADAKRYLEAKADNALLGLITDGPAFTQRAKVRALGLEHAFGRAVFTDSLGLGRGKPHPLGFEHIEYWARPYGLQLAYIGDNPSKDFFTPRQRGWLTVRIDRPGRIHLAEAPGEAHEAHATIASLDELDACLAELHDNRRISFTESVSPAQLS